MHGYLFPVRLVGHTFEHNPVQGLLTAPALRFEVGRVRLFTAAG